MNEQELRLWARNNYKAGTPVESHWNQTIRDECIQINIENIPNRLPKHDAFIGYFDSKPD